jgi:hypothetical protein
VEKGEKALDLFTKAGVAYAGARATGHWTGAITALVALRLATGGNLAGGLAGTGVLTVIGVGNLAPRTDNPYIRRELADLDITPGP